MQDNTGHRYCKSAPSVMVSPTTCCSDLKASHRNEISMGLRLQSPSNFEEFYLNSQSFEQVDGFDQVLALAMQQIPLTNDMNEQVDLIMESLKSEN